MSVEIIWSSTNGGSTLTSEVDHGDVKDEGVATTPIEIFVRHNGLNEITNTKLYIAPKSDSYDGVNTATQDYNDLIRWGDDDKGVQINLNATGGYPSADWQSIKTGSGDTKDNGIPLAVATGASSTGTIPASAA